MLTPESLTFYLKTHDFSLKHFNKHLVCILYMYEQSLNWALLLTPTCMQALPIIKQLTVNTNQPTESKNSSKFSNLRDNGKVEKTYLWEENDEREQMLDDQIMQYEWMGCKGSEKIEEIWGGEGVGFVGFVVRKKKKTWRRRVCAWCVCVREKGF